jgi:pimeloyl-ACP methyl ester carboxylesterase
VSDDEELSLRIVGIEPGGEPADAELAGGRSLRLLTTRGEIPLIVHEAQGAHEALATGRAVVCISGALGGFDGPAKLYVRLGQEMPGRGVAVVRLNYRMPNEFGECVLDTMAGLAFAKATHHERAALIGHSFGGAVAINAGTLAPAVTTVIAISSQLYGAHVVAELAPRPLLLLHGTADTILPHGCSERLYERAQEPRTLKLFAGVGHRFSEAPGELLETVREWLLARP